MMKLQNLYLIIMVFSTGMDIWLHDQQPTSLTVLFGTLFVVATVKDL